MFGVIDFIIRCIIGLVVVLGGFLTLSVLLILMFIDFITGFLVAIKHKRVTSRALRDGVLAKGGALLLITSFALLITGILENPAAIDIIGTDPFILEVAPSVFVLIFIIGEFISITENAHGLGVKIPKFLSKFLKKVGGDQWQ